MKRDKVLERQLKRLAHQMQEGSVPADPIIKLSAENSLTVMEAILHPKPAGPQLRQALERYKTMMGDR